jgi:hypothetical protein
MNLENISCLVTRARLKMIKGKFEIRALIATRFLSNWNYNRPEYSEPLSVS